MLLATGALIAASAQWPDRFLKFDMFPQDAGRQIVLDYGIEGSHPIERVASAVEQIESYFEQHRAELEINTIYSRFDAESAVSVLQLVPKERAKMRATEVIAKVSGKLPEIIIGKPSFQFDQQGGSDGLSVQITGESTERLASIAGDVTRVLAKIEGIDTARTDARNGDAEVEIEVDRARAAALGLSPQQIASSVAAAMRGDRLRELRAPEREYILRLAFRANDKQNVADLANLPLYLPTGERITLGSVAEFRVSRGARVIERVNRMTSVGVQTTLVKDASLNAVRDRVENVLKNYSLPAGYSWKFGRGVEQDDEAQKVMLFNLLIAIAMIYLVMAAVFESSALPLSIITSILLAVIGVVWTLFLTRTTMTFMALIGIQILMGVVVNIGIVLVAHINDLRHAGMDRSAAILQAGRDRLRPILMTTATTVLGLLPLALGDSQLAVGTGGPSYAPMARTIMGGLAFGALTSLFIVPVFYIWLDNARDRLARFWKRTAPSASLNATEF
jgi:HAE1 family hydrophobic/amphiphilic exporter-1